MPACFWDCLNLNWWVYSRERILCISIKSAYSELLIIFTSGTLMVVVCVSLKKETGFVRTFLVIGQLQENARKDKICIKLNQGSELEINLRDILKKIYYAIKMFQKSSFCVEFSFFVVFPQLSRSGFGFSQMLQIEQDTMSLVLIFCKIWREKNVQFCKQKKVLGSV